MFHTSCFNQKKMDKILTKDIDQIQFGILSPEEIEAGSVVQVKHYELYENKKPKINGLLDPRMGCIDRNYMCATCEENMNTCPGHYGHIKLTHPVYHVGFIKTVKKLLECICLNCSRIRLPPDDPYFKLLSKMKISSRFNAVWNKCKNKPVCEYTDCGCQLYPIRRQGVVLYVEKRQHASSSMQIQLQTDQVRHVLQHISDDTCRLLGLVPEDARPEWMIITILLVPPPPVRPSIIMDATKRGEDDLTQALVQILRYNELLQEYDTPENREQLQYHVASYFDNSMSGVPSTFQKGGRPITSIASRLKGKEGRIRGNLMGKRVDFSARTVITGDPCLSMDEIGVPRSVAYKLTYEMRVNDINRRILQQHLESQTTKPYTIRYIQKKDGGIRYNLAFTPVEKLPLLEIGDIVERTMQDGDLILFNRQPTLHKMSMMAHRVRVMDGQTFRMNVNVCSSYNADFDGDEMNVHLPQSEQTRAELLCLSTVSDNLVSSQSSKPVNALCQDTLRGAQQMTRRDTFFTYEEVCQLSMWCNEAEIPPPTIFKPVTLWTGKQVFSMFCPKTLNTSGYHSSHPETEKPRTLAGSDQHDFFKSNTWNTRYDTHLLIRNGELLTGMICKRSIGQTAGGIVHIIYKDLGPNATRLFMDNVSQVVTYYLLHNGASVGIGDAILDKNTQKDIDEGIQEQMEKIEGISSTSSNYENEVMQCLSKARDLSGKKANKNVGFLHNNISQMINSGSKGSILNMCQIAACVGQQIVDGKRVPNGFKERTLPCFDKFNESPLAHGFVKNSFIRGLYPVEFFFHASGGREGLIDTAIKSVTGDTSIIIQENGNTRQVKIGDWIDLRLQKSKDRVEHHTTRQLEFLEIAENIYIPTMDDDGNIFWGKIAAVTRHDPGVELYRVTTKSGRTVTVTESNSLLVWDEMKKQFLSKPTPEVKLGDYLPVTAKLAPPPATITFVDMTEYFPKTEYIHGTDFNIAVKCMVSEMNGSQQTPRGWWDKNNGITFTLPYSKKSLLQRASTNIEDTFIYPYHASREHAKISDRFILDYDNGMFIGLFLAEGNAYGGTVCITNNDPTIRDFVKKWFERHSIVCQEELLSVRGFSTLLGRFLTKFVGSGARNKFVPDVAFCAPEEFVTGLLSGYISGDGCVDKSGICASTVSERLCDGIIMLCSRLGVFVTKRLSQQKSNKTAPIYDMSICSLWATEFSTKVKLLMPQKQLKMQSQIHNNAVLDAVVQIEIIGVENNPKVYDLTIPETFNFGIANGLMLRDTAETGYIQRKLVKSLEDLYVTYDGSVRNGQNNIVQFWYGDDHMDGTYLEKQSLDTLNISDDHFWNKYHIYDEEFKQLKEDRDYIRKVHAFNPEFMSPVNLIRLILNARSIHPSAAATNEYLTDYIAIFERVKKLRLSLNPFHGFKSSEHHMNRIFLVHLSSTFASKRVINEHKLTKKQFDYICEEISKQYYHSFVQAGEMVGVVAATNIAAPTTQLTLNSIEWNTEILLKINGKLFRYTIGEFIDREFDIAKKENIESHPNDTWLAWLKDDEFQILSCDQDGRIMWKQIEAVTRHPVVNKDGTNTLIKVTLQSGRSITATKGKSFLKRIDNKIQQVDGADLVVGDYLPVSKILPTGEDYKYLEFLPKEKMIELDEEFGWFCGAYLAEGNCTENHIMISNLDDNERLDEFCNRWQLKYHIQEGPQNGKCTYRIDSLALTIVVTKLFGNGSANKRIPPQFLAAPDEFLIGLISGYFVGGDEVSASRGLLEDIRQILTKFGIEPSISAQSDDSYAIKFPNSHRLNKLLSLDFKLTIPHKVDHLQNFMMNGKPDVVPDVITIQYGKRTYQRHELSNLSLNLENDKKLINHILNEEDIMYDRVVSIEEVCSDHHYVYDFTVKDTKNFAVYNGVQVRDTFHTSGAGNNSMTLSGVPRIKELINATHNIKTPSMRVYLLREFQQDRQCVEYIASRIKQIRLIDLLVSAEIFYDPDYRNSLLDQDRNWLKLVHEYILPEAVEPDELEPWVIRFELSKIKLKQLQICVCDIVNVIENAIGRNIYIEYSSDNYITPVIHIRIYHQQKQYDDNNQYHKTEDFLKYLQFELTNNLIIRGLCGVTNTIVVEKPLNYYKRDSGEMETIQEYVIETEGINMRDLVKIPGVDLTRVSCNQPHEMMEIFGIEVARNSFLNEFKYVLESGGSHISFRHLAILCDKMTHLGKITAITRHGVKKTDAGVLMKCSFEQPVDVILDAAATGSYDTVEGVTAPIMLGKVSKIGSGLPVLLLDERKLNCNGIFKSDNVVENDLEGLIQTSEKLPWY